MAKTLHSVLNEIASLPSFEAINPLTVLSHDCVGDTPLHVATVRGDVEDISILIQAGADINAPGEYGNRPLHEAVSQGKVEAVKTLIKLGADTEIKNDDGLTAGELAKLLENEEIKQLMNIASSSENG